MFKASSDPFFRIDLATNLEQIKRLLDLVLVFFFGKNVNQVISTIVLGTQLDGVTLIVGVATLGNCNKQPQAGQSIDQPATFFEAEDGARVTVLQT